MEWKRKILFMSVISSGSYFLWKLCKKVFFFSFFLLLFATDKNYIHSQAWYYTLIIIRVCRFVFFKFWFKFKTPDRCGHLIIMHNIFFKCWFRYDRFEKVSILCFCNTKNFLCKICYRWKTGYSWSILLRQCSNF